MPGSKMLDALFRWNNSRLPEESLQESLRAVLTQANFVPVARHVIGWRGVCRVVAPVECWTFKIHCHRGVFGLAFQGLCRKMDDDCASFWLYYFPDPEETLIEQCTMAAAAATQQPDYMSKIRHFPRFPQFTDLFFIGEFFLSIRDGGEAFSIALEASNLLRIISRAGIRYLRGNEEVELVAPGGYAQNFPAQETAFNLFEVLAASFTFNANQPPTRLQLFRSPGRAAFQDASGKLQFIEDPEIWNHFFRLDYGRVGSSQAAAPAGDGIVLVSHWQQGEVIPAEYEKCLWWTSHKLDAGRSLNKKLLGIDQRPPLIVITGFLGAGKTTFLQKFIEYQTQRSRFVAVIQNEIGAKGLDGMLLDYTVTEIDEGCVCCSLSGNLKQAIHGILQSFDPDCVMVETTGLANPYNLLDELDELEELVRFDSIVTFVDALNIEKTLAAYPLAVEQIRGADILALNKTDLIDARKTDQVIARLKALNARAPLFPVVDGGLHPSLILGLDVDHLSDRPLKDNASKKFHPSHLHADVWTQTRYFPNALDPDIFSKAIELLPASVFRAKGIIQFRDTPHLTLFQFVAGRYDLAKLKERGPDTPFITFIGKGQAALDALMRTCDTMGVKTSLN